MSAECTVAHRRQIPPRGTGLEDRLGDDATAVRLLLSVG